jgi:hypothetical protein
MKKHEPDVASNGIISIPNFVIIDEFAESVKSTEYTHAQMVIS